MVCCTHRLTELLLNTAHHEESREMKMVRQTGPMHWEAQKDPPDPEAGLG
jgi:hypothetical protein